MFFDPLRIAQNFLPLLLSANNLFSERLIPPHSTFLPVPKVRGRVGDCCQSPYPKISVMLPREGGGASEELRLRAQYLAEQEVGQSARAQTEPLVGEPLLSEHFLDNGVIYQSIVNCVQSARWLESNLNACLLYTSPSPRDRG